MQKCFIDRQQLVNVAKEYLRLIRRNDRGVLATSICTQWVGIQLLEDPQALYVVPLGRDELVDKVEKGGGVSTRAMPPGRLRLAKGIRNIADKGLKGRAYHCCTRRRY